MSHKQKFQQFGGLYFVPTIIIVMVVSGMISATVSLVPLS